MDKSQAVRLLRCQDAGLVDYALGLANLTRNEKMAVELCGRRGYTQEQAAEKAGVSVEAIRKWYAAGMRQICAAWSGLWWIQRIVAGT